MENSNISNSNKKGNGDHPDGSEPVEQQQQEENRPPQQPSPTEHHAYILVEIVSALCVPSMDAVTESDSFVEVYLGENNNNRIHKTKVIPNTSNPIWTLETRSLFMIQATSSGDETVRFLVKDRDTIKRDDFLGVVTVKVKDML